MPAIQIDMFEVQLGAAILLQFEADDAVLRVLADAGVKAGGYLATHVRDKLKAMLSERTRIDLMIGTHYDEDHLNGLVPIIEDPSFSIGETWMPPVANDTQSFAADQPVASGDLLTTQLAREDGDEVLAVYLAAKRRDIETVGALEAELDPDGVARMKRVALQKAEFFASEDPLDLRFFRAQLEQDGRAFGRPVSNFHPPTGDLLAPPEAPPSLPSEQAALGRRALLLTRPKWNRPEEIGLDEVRLAVLNECPGVRSTKVKGLQRPFACCRDISLGISR